MFIDRKKHYEAWKRQSSTGSFTAEDIKNAIYLDKNKVNIKESKAQEDDNVFRQHRWFKDYQKW